MKALQELENVDDDADQLGIAFVKINDPDLADEYSLGSLPALVYYRRRIPVVYDGEWRREAGRGRAGKGDIKKKVRWVKEGIEREGGMRNGCQGEG